MGRRLTLSLIGLRVSINQHIQKCKLLHQNIALGCLDEVEQGRRQVGLETLRHGELSCPCYRPRERRVTWDYSESDIDTCEITMQDHDATVAVFFGHHVGGHGKSHFRQRFALDKHGLTWLVVPPCEWNFPSILRDNMLSYIEDPDVRLNSLRIDTGPLTANGSWHGPALAPRRACFRYALHR